MTPRSPSALFLALAPFGLMAGLGWSLAWTTGETAVFLLGFALMMTPAIWAACLFGLERRHVLFAAWVALAWAAILPGTGELEARFTTMRFEAQRPALEAEVARIEALPAPHHVDSMTVLVDEALSPFGEAWTSREAGASEIWFLRRRDRAFVYTEAPAAAFGPYTTQRCRHLDGPWYDCEF